MDWFVLRNLDHGNVLEIFSQARSYLYAKYAAGYTLSPDLDILKYPNLQ